MTPTERAKRSDALYYETVSVNRRVLCDMVANREADLEDARESVRRLMTQRDERLARAETDNAKLREEFNKMDVWHSKELTAAMAENAKLRELVSGLEHCVQGLACNCCPLYDPSGTNHRRCESLERELGIEVDG